jgi:hypothetical protein
MAGNLYDTGAPQRVIVEHEHRIVVEGPEDSIAVKFRGVKRYPVEMDDVIDITPERTQIEALKGK